MRDVFDGEPTDKPEGVVEVRKQSIFVSVVDWDAQKLGFSDERRLWTRGAHIQHELDAVLLHITKHTTKHNARSGANWLLKPALAK